MKERGYSGLKAGLALEEAVSDYLHRLGIDHRRTEAFGEEDVVEKLDLVIPSRPGSPDFEIQLTLRPKHLTKIFDFALRSLTTFRRSIRLYIEVVGSHRRSADLQIVGERVAKAIQTIVRRFRDFGREKLLGLRIHANTSSPRIEKFDLIELCGERLLARVRVWQEEQRRIAEERHAAQTTNTPTVPRPVPFWKTLLAKTRFLVEGHYPLPRGPFIDVRSHFMPRRLC